MLQYLLPEAVLLQCFVYRPMAQTWSTMDCWLSLFSCDNLSWTLWLVLTNFIDVGVAHPGPPPADCTRLDLLKPFRGAMVGWAV